MIITPCHRWAEMYFVANILFQNESHLINNIYMPIFVEALSGSCLYIYIYYPFL